MQENQTRVQWFCDSANIQELQDRHDQWADDHDHGPAEEFGWNSPQITSEVFAKHVDRSGRILDAGAGTGLVGQWLANGDYKDLAAIDLSNGMLGEARGKNVYTEFHQMVLGETLDFATGAFDAVISVGVFTLDHAPASGFDLPAIISNR